MTDSFQWEHFELGSPCTLAECPIGLFFCNGELCLKTEYGSNEGRIDAYIVKSGEFFWGAHPQTILNQREQTVTPVLGPRAAYVLAEGPGRFKDWTNALLASECRAQARENIDPEYSQFMRAVAERLTSQSVAATDVQTERQRQIESEGWTPEHDDEHFDGSLAQAAAAYAYSASSLGRSHGRLWPWHPDGWKPTDRRRDLVKAGALILAEIERLDRAAIRSGGEQ